MKLHKVVRPAQTSHRRFETLRPLRAELFEVPR